MGAAQELFWERTLCWDSGWLTASSSHTLGICGSILLCHFLPKLLGTSEPAGEGDPEAQPLHPKHKSYNVQSLLWASPNSFRLHSRLRLIPDPLPPSLHSFTSYCSLPSSFTGFTKYCPTILIHLIIFFPKDPSWHMYCTLHPVADDEGLRARQ